MDLVTLEESLEEIFGPDQFTIDESEEGEIIIRTGLRKNSDDELVAWSPEDEDEEDDEDEEFDPDLEPLLDDDSDE